jgi:hypothetical protein
VAPFALPDVEVVCLEGIDALAFAQAQFASDVRELVIGRWAWSCWLNAQGRVIAVFALLRPSETQWLLVLPGVRGDEICTRLRRFVLRSKLSISRPGLLASGTFGSAAAPLAAAGGVLLAHDGGWELALGGAGDRRLQLATQVVAPDAGLRERWRATDVLDAIPWLEGLAVEAWIPQALALQRLAAFSTRKGCYPGQEIVARTHFLGRNRRALWRGSHAASGPPPAIGARLLAIDAAPDAAAQAEVVLAASADGLGCLLAVGIEGGEGRLRLDGTTTAIDCEPVPLD